MTHQPKAQQEIESYETSHEAIQTILRSVKENEMARTALQHLRTEIYSIIRDDKTPYQCRIYIQDLDFVFRIREGGKELIINVMDHGAEYCWPDGDKRWFANWLDPLPSKKLGIKFKTDKTTK